MFLILKFTFFPHANPAFKIVVSIALVSDQLNYISRNLIYCNINSSPRLMLKSGLCTTLRLHALTATAVH